MSALDSAEIFEALGDYGRAANLRWGIERTPPVYLRDLNDEIASLRDEIEQADRINADLKALLCAKCRKRWEARQ